MPKRRRPPKKPLPEVQTEVEAVSSKVDGNVTGTIQTRELSIPLDASHKPVSRNLHIDISVPADIADATLRPLTRALDKQQATLANGRRITQPAHAVRWILEQLARDSGSNGESSFF